MGKKKINDLKKPIKEKIGIFRNRPISGFFIALKLRANNSFYKILPENTSLTH